MGFQILERGSRANFGYLDLYVISSVAKITGLRRLGDIVQQNPRLVCERQHGARVGGREEAMHGGVAYIANPWESETGGSQT